MSLMTESDITTRIGVTADTTELDNLRGFFPTLDALVDNLESRFENICGTLSQKIAVELLSFEQMEFNYHKHPYETGVGGNSFYAKDDGSNYWIVDNSAENNGFPYMVTEELGSNPGRVLSPHPFVAPSREVVIDELDALFKEVWG